MNVELSALPAGQPKAGGRIPTQIRSRHREAAAGRLSAGFPLKNLKKPASSCNALYPACAKVFFLHQGFPAEPSRPFPAKSYCRKNSTEVTTRTFLM